MLYKINGKPEGVHAVDEGISALQGLNVEAEKVENKMVVAKTKIVAALKAASSRWADYWGKTNLENFSFPIA